MRKSSQGWSFELQTPNVWILLCTYSCLFLFPKLLVFGFFKTHQWQSPIVLKLLKFCMFDKLQPRHIIRTYIYSESVKEQVLKYFGTPANIYTSICTVFTRFWFYFQKKYLKSFYINFGKRHPCIWLNFFVASKRILAKNVPHWRPLPFSKYLVDEHSYIGELNW